MNLFFFLTICLDLLRLRHYSIKQVVFFEPLNSGKTKLAVKIILQRFSVRALPLICPFSTAAGASSWFMAALNGTLWPWFITVEVCSDFSSAHSPVSLSHGLSVRNAHTLSLSRTHRCATTTNFNGFFLRGCVYYSFSVLQYRWVLSSSGRLDRFFFLV